MEILESGIRLNVSGERLSTVGDRHMTGEHPASCTWVGIEHFCWIIMLNDYKVGFFPGSSSREILLP